MNRQQLIDKMKKVVNQLEDTTYYSDYTKMYSVNVKRYSDYVDVDALVSKTPSYQPFRNRITEDFDEQALNDIYYSWLEYEQRYVIEDWLKGCTISSYEYWQEQIDKLAKGEKIGYPYADNHKTIEARVAEVKKWQAKDKREARYLDLIDTDKAGFYGRSGGHFCILPVGGLIHEDILDLAYKLADKEITVAEAMDEYSGLKEQADAVLWVLAEVEDMNKGMRFEDEVIFRIDENIEQYEQEARDQAEVHIAKKYAEKHGYVLAKAI